MSNDRPTRLIGQPLIDILCSFIKGMTNVWLLHNLLILTLYTVRDFTEVQPEKLCVRRNPWKGIINIRTVFRVQGCQILHPRDRCSSEPLGCDCLETWFETTGNSVLNNVYINDDPMLTLPIILARVPYVYKRSVSS